MLASETSRRTRWIAGTRGCAAKVTIDTATRESPRLRKRETMTSKSFHANDLEHRIEALTGVPIDEDDRIDSRLAFDWALMPTRRWAQIDTTETSGPDNCYGMWTNPFERRILTYTEGDISDTVYADDAEYARALAAIAEKELAKDTWIGIDAGYPQVEAQLVTAGAGDLLRNRLPPTRH